MYSALDDLHKWHSVEGKGKSSTIEHPNSYGSGGWWSVTLSWKDMEVVIDSLAETGQFKCTTRPRYLNAPDTHKVRRMYHAVRDMEDDSNNDVDDKGWPTPDELIVKALEVIKDFDKIWNANEL